MSAMYCRFAVNYLAASLASRQTDALPECLRGLLPVRIELHRAATVIPVDARTGESGMLWNAISAEIARLVGRPAADALLPHLQSKLSTQGGLILLDGLDEAPESGRRRKCILESIQAFARDLPNCRFLLTARPYAYADPNWQLPNFEILALAPFNERQVQNFVHSWYQAVGPAMQWTVDESGRRALELIAALKVRPDLNDLASRPLLLTLMTTLHSHKSRMPEDRAELYEFSIGLLLSRWQMGRQEKDAQGRWIVDPGIEQSLGLGEQKLRSALEELALQTHMHQSERQDRQNEVLRSADIGLSEVIAMFSKHAPADLNPTVLLEYLENRAGLLIGRGNDVYTFPHRSFQEYLAACRLANTERDLAAKLLAHLQNDLDWWREIYLLAVGKKRQGGRGDAVDLINRLIPGSPNEMLQINDMHWRQSVLAGEAALDLRLANFIGESEYFQTVLQRLRMWLLSILEEHRLTLAERLHAGDILGYLGDTRPGVATISIGQGKQSIELPDINWVHIPASNFKMGSKDDDQDAFPEECPYHELDLREFWISRYLVTNAQFSAFMEQDGYNQEQYWTPDGWDWRNGKLSLPEISNNKDYVKRYKVWVMNRTDRGRPNWWGHLRWGSPNRPVVGITWYEALAFTNWLEKQYEEFNRHLPNANVFKLEKKLWEELMQSNWVIGLPSEAEWEKAARVSLQDGFGTDRHSRRWSWGDTWQAYLANTNEAGLGETSPVGMFPAGSNQLYDMTGNVWEWTRSKWGINGSQPDYGYPYQTEDKRELLVGSEFRVVRGGSWFFNERFARCACRNRFIPTDFVDALGFRLVLSRRS